VFSFIRLNLLFLILFNLIDAISTAVLLSLNAAEEANPGMWIIIESFGLPGMFIYKALFLILICWLAIKYEIKYGWLLSTSLTIANIVYVYVIFKQAHIWYQAFDLQFLSGVF